MVRENLMYNTYVNYLEEEGGESLEIQIKEKITLGKLKKLENSSCNNRFIVGRRI